jgi:tripartite-type tricarboxylate transporter receptor subunit TctC
MKMGKWATFGGVVVGVLLAGISSAWAAGYPERPISLIEPHSPGSISDIGARVLAQQLSKELGQPVRVVEATGANTAVGASKMQMQPPDGYAVFWDIISQLAYVITSKALPYNADDFHAVGTVGGEAMAVIARADDKRFRTVAALVLYAKAHPDALMVADGGPGHAQRALDDLDATAHIRMKSIADPGGSTILTTLLGGHVDLAVAAPSSVVRNPKLRIVMILTKAKSYPPIPKVETAGSVGYDIDAPLLRAVFVKRGTPAPIVATLSKAVATAVESPAWHDYAKRFSQIEAPSNPAAATAELKK